MTTETKKTKKRPPPRKKASPEIKETASAIISIAEESSSKSIEMVKQEAPSEANYDWLRRLAENIYVTHPGHISWRKLAELPEFKGKIHPRTINRYCSEDDWVKKRKAYFDGLQEIIKNRVASAQVQARVDHLEKFSGIFEKMLARMEDVEPNSMEGLATAIVRVGKFMEEMRVLVSAEIVPEKGTMAPGTTGSPVPPELNADEARAAALAVIRMRQEASKKAPEEPEESK